MQEILTYRAARTARDLFNADDKQKAFAVLADSPALLRLLSRMTRAQQGRPLDAPNEREALSEGMSAAQEHRTTAEPEES